MHALLARRSVRRGNRPPCPPPPKCARRQSSRNTCLMRRGYTPSAHFVRPGASPNRWGTDMFHRQGLTKRLTYPHTPCRPSIPTRLGPNWACGRGEVMNPPLSISLAAALLDLTYPSLTAGTFHRSFGRRGRGPPDITAKRTTHNTI